MDIKITDIFHISNVKSRISIQSHPHTNSGEKNTQYCFVMMIRETWLNPTIPEEAIKLAGTLHTRLTRQVTPVRAQGKDCVCTQTTAGAQALRSLTLTAPHTWSI